MSWRIEDKYGFAIKMVAGKDILRSLCIFSFSNHCFQKSDTMFSLHSTLFASLLCCFLARANAFLVGSEQDLLKRGSVVQGWALVEDIRPQGTGVCGQR